jgi:hypothetical protein
MSGGICKFVIRVKLDFPQESDPILGAWLLAIGATYENIPTSRSCGFNFQDIWFSGGFNF